MSIPGVKPCRGFTFHFAENMSIFGKNSEVISKIIILENNEYNDSEDTIIWKFKNKSATEICFGSCIPLRIDHHDSLTHTESLQIHKRVDSENINISHNILKCSVNTDSNNNKQSLGGLKIQSGSLELYTDYQEKNVQILQYYDPEIEELFYQEVINNPVRKFNLLDNDGNIRYEEMYGFPYHLYKSQNKLVIDDINKTVSPSKLIIPLWSTSRSLIFKYEKQNGVLDNLIEQNNKLQQLCQDLATVINNQQLQINNLETQIQNQSQLQVDEIKNDITELNNALTILKELFEHHDLTLQVLVGKISPEDIQI